MFLPEIVADIGNAAERRLVHLTRAVMFQAGTDPRDEALQKSEFLTAFLL